MPTVYMPVPHCLLSQRNQGMPWWKALAEIVDNSFEADANRVEIAYKNKTLVISDNGRGMKDITAAVRLGDHQPSGKGISMYGVGLKDAWLSSGDRIDIATVRNGVKTELTVDINSFNERWEGPDPVTSETSEKNGTVITLHVRKDRNRPDDGVKDKLSWVFSPGLASGKQIVWSSDSKTGKPLQSARLPLFSEVVQDSFEIDGKAVIICIGILKEGEKIKNGPFWFQYKHRIIESSPLGCKGKDSSRIGGTVHLGDGWVFTKNKDAITEKCDELEEAIHQRIWHLLQKADKLSIDIENGSLKSELEGMLNNAIGEAKREARESKKDSRGTVEPKQSGRKRSNAQKVHEQLPGSVVTSDGKKRRGFSIDWGNMEDDVLGTYYHRTNTVSLNLDHSYVVAVKDPRNTPALFAIAVAILSDWLCNHKDSEKCMFEIEDFGTTFGKLVKSIRISNDQRAAQ